MEDIFDMETNDDETINQALYEIDLEVEELEAIIAPAVAANHNETLVSDEAN
jgi:hypothetical protein